MSNVVTKKDLAEKLATECNLTKKDATTYVKFVVDEVVASLANNDTVDLSGLGKFMITERKARKGINPFTKEEIDIPASNAVRFKPSKSLKDAVK
ncbi:HU family DNA-binding protein [uncultured Faecalicoccus sp.]|uniref:HU family DNA-binding protein n=1 Tax=uncultured Faecalicoccus sp. TaxID=1971760 RepID=UPI0025EE858E|nr:HU family DNA-binding protein [uncultured Faecalicoccus sp.]